MAVSIDSRPDDKRYLGNNSSGHMEVHDLENEKKGENECQIDEIIRAGNAVVFDPDTLDQAHDEGYDNSEYCLGESER